MRCYKTIGGYFAREAVKRRRRRLFSSFFDDGREEQEGEGEEEEKLCFTPFHSVQWPTTPSSGSALRSLPWPKVSRILLLKDKEAMRFARKASALSPFFCKLSIWSISIQSPVRGDRGTRWRGSPGISRGLARASRSRPKIRQRVYVSLEMREALEATRFRGREWKVCLGILMSPSFIAREPHSETCIRSKYLRFAVGVFSAVGNFFSVVVEGVGHHGSHVITVGVEHV